MTEQAATESLVFGSSDRYPMGPAAALAARHGLHFPDVRTSLHRWADYLAGRSA